MTKKPSRVRILMMPYQEDENSDPVGYSGPATFLTRPSSDHQAT
jgi:prophage regulatory protein